MLRLLAMFSADFCRARECGPQGRRPKAAVAAPPPKAAPGGGGLPCGPSAVCRLSPLDFSRSALCKTPAISKKPAACRSGAVPADLPVAGDRGSPVLQIHPAQNGIFAVLFAERNDGLLPVPLPLQLGGLAAAGRIAAEKIKLFSLVRLKVLPVQQSGCRHGDFSDGKRRLGDLIKQAGGRLH